MPDLLNTLLKISLVIFMAGNLLDMGLRLQLGTALVGLRNVRFVSFSLLWCFVLGPAVAYGLTRVVPLEAPYAMGLILIGMAPCAPFLPMMVDRARGDLGYTASFMLLASVGMVAFMPFAVPLLVDGLSVSAWVIAKPLLAVVLVPLVIGMVTLRRAPDFAARVQPVVKKITGLVTIIMLGLCLVIYGKAFIGSAGSYATLDAGHLLRRRHRGFLRAGLRAAAEPEERAARSVCARAISVRPSRRCSPWRAPTSGRSSWSRSGCRLQTIAAVVAAHVFGARAEGASA